MKRLRILTWNIQNLGPTKIAQPDVMAAIAQVVREKRPDLFIVLEINTASEEMAHQIATVVQGALREEGSPDWSTYAISWRTGVEFYGFFVRTARTRPVVLAPADAADGNGEPVTLNEPGKPERALAGQRFRVLEEPGGCVFPLIMPNLVRPGRRHRAAWTGARLPCLAMFEVEGSILPLLVGHLAANWPQATQQIHVLPCFDVLDGACGGRPLQVRIGEGLVPLPHVVVTGDFNVHLDPEAYPGAMAVPLRDGFVTDDEGAGGEEKEDDPPAAHADPDDGGPVEMAVAAPAAGGGKRSAGYAGLLGAPQSKKALGMRGVIGVPTHLATADEFDSRVMKDTAGLAVRTYDNFFLTRGLQVEQRCVVDVPGMFRRRRRPLVLDRSVDAYAAQEKRNLHDRAYEARITNLAAQLRQGSPQTMSLAAALTGARLISDHVPVVVDVLLP